MSGLIMIWLLCKTIYYEWSNNDSIADDLINLIYPHKIYSDKIYTQLYNPIQTFLSLSKHIGKKKSIGKNVVSKKWFLTMYSNKMW